MEDTVCEKCHMVLREGMWPFCPHPLMEGRVNIERDEIPGGITLENYGAQPITFYSHSERRAHMKAHGLEEKETFCPFPGTDKDPAGIPNPEGYVDDYTMRNRIALVLRANGAAPTDDSVEGVIGDTFSGTLTNKDAAAVQQGTKRARRVGRRLHG